MTAAATVAVPAAAAPVDPGDDLSLTPPPRQQRLPKEQQQEGCDEDFEAFTQSAQSLEFQAETKDGTIVMATGRIKPDDSSAAAAVQSEQAASFEKNGAPGAPPRTVSEQVDDKKDGGGAITTEAAVDSSSTVESSPDNKGASEPNVPTITEEERTHRFVTPKGKT